MLKGLRVWFPALMSGGSQSLVTTAPGDLTLFSDLHGCPHACAHILANENLCVIPDSPNKTSFLPTVFIISHVHRKDLNGFHFSL